ncbi:hypothetical protein NUW54_g7912 [Trametes sanguinea]|uniref:Uncharacterized protein n=1 Tax=Trametes sanguinea TaxID=158606 RepID=A0ACC1PHY9_9APHY|nr:hypothetical protein NUW54_g7912 [Trametes sanguinea]
MRRDSGYLEPMMPYRYYALDPDLLQAMRLLRYHAAQEPLPQPQDHNGKQMHPAVMIELQVSRGEPEPHEDLHLHVVPSALLSHSSPLRAIHRMTQIEAAAAFTDHPIQMSSPSSEQQPYVFTETQDWFSFNTDTWRGLFQHVSATRPRVLEIGSWEGRSAVFLLTELCKSSGEIVCIDHFDLMDTPAGRERHRKLTQNLALTSKPFRILAEFSVPALMTLLVEEMSRTQPGFDWIYVDGSHEARRSRGLGLDDQTEFRRTP